MKGHQTKRVALPGGRVIEIVYFSDSAEPVDDAGQGEAEATGHPVPAPVTEPLDGESPLHLCPSCSSSLVYPVAWEERSSDRWCIERRCPNCEWRDVDEFHQTQVERFDDVLNDGTENLLATLRNYARANMEADVERLVDAIQRDRIEPMDF